MSDVPTDTCLWRAGKSAHPGFEVSQRDFTEQLAKRRSRGDTVTDGGEVYLACGCALAIPEALHVFERDYLSFVRSLALSRGLDVGAADDIKQVVRTRLLMADEDMLRICRYAGRGELHGLVRTVAIRCVLEYQRREGREHVRRKQIEYEVVQDGPEDELMRRRYSRDFKAAFEEAIANASVRDRTLLRMHLVDGIGIDRTARIYRVHRATAARWIAMARESLAERSREILRSRLDVNAATLHSVLRLLDSGLDLSLPRVLAEQDDLPPRPQS